MIPISWQISGLRSRSLSDFVAAEGISVLQTFLAINTVRIFWNSNFI